MVDIVLDSEELTVLGGPSEINVELNVGATGKRGVFIFADFPLPTSPLATFSEPPVLFDLYLVLDPGSDFYLTMFQYLLQDGVLTWVEVIQLTFNTYNTSRTVTFVNGVGEVQIDAFELGFGKNIPLPAIENSKNYVSIQATPNATDPISLSVEVNDLVSITSEETISGLVTYIPVTLHAVEYVGGTWQPINGNRVISMSVNLQNPGDLLLGLIDEGS